MAESRVRDIKHAQRESFLFRQIADYYLKIAQDAPDLAALFVSRVKLSPDRGSCTVYFYAEGGIKQFEAVRPQLVLYKSALRTALAKSSHSRYVPQLRFAFDAQLEKQQKVEDLIDKLKEEGKL